MPSERIQKILARAGFGSRRACETLISTGRVQVNGQAVTLGDKADPQQDKITVDGQAIRAEEALAYIALYKPRGVLSTVIAPDPRPTVRDLVDLPGQLYPVGRLDVESEGLILLTNDGDLANRLTHPRYGHEKEYKVLVARHPDEEQLNNWRRGVVLEDGYRTAPAIVSLVSLSGKGAWLRVVLREGRKRQIRETGSLLGLPVVKIIRVRIGSLLLGALQPRQWRHLTPQEVAALKGQPGGPGVPDKKPGLKKPAFHKPSFKKPAFKKDAPKRPAVRARKRE
ncbi:MAG TPA: pseudouridine synthase [Anaerolineales bacterium]